MSRPATDQAVPGQRVALVDLLDRVLSGGVVITGDITLSIADVELVTVSLRALVTSVSSLLNTQALIPAGGNDGRTRPGLPAGTATADPDRP